MEYTLQPNTALPDPTAQPQTDAERNYRSDHGQFRLYTDPEIHYDARFVVRHAQDGYDGPLGEVEFVYDPAPQSHPNAPRFNTYQEFAQDWADRFTGLLLSNPSSAPYRALSEQMWDAHVQPEDWEGALQLLITQVNTGYRPSQTLSEAQLIRNTAEEYDDGMAGSTFEVGHPGDIPERPWYLRVTLLEKPYGRDQEPAGDDGEDEPVSDDGYVSG